MPKVDFSQIDDVTDYSPIPEGDYLCRLTDVEESETRNGDDLWKLRFAVEKGEFAGRCVFDNLVFSEKALPRVKLICSRLGVDMSGELDLQPHHLLEKTCLITVTIEDYEDEEGNTKKCNRVPFAGYEFADDDGGEDDGEENTPF